MSDHFDDYHPRHEGAWRSWGTRAEGPGRWCSIALGWDLARFTRPPGGQSRRALRRFGTWHSDHHWSVNIRNRMDT